MNRTRGSAIAFVSFVIVLLSVFLGVVVGATIFQSQLAVSQEMRSHARDLAEGAVQMALSRLATNEGFNSEISMPVDGYPLGSSGHLVFSVDRARQLECRYSTNNLNNDASVPGDGLSVPAQCVHLVGLGICGGVRCQVQAIVRRPPFPLGLAASGPVFLEGVRVWGLEDNQPYDPAAPQLPAHVFSNSNKEKALNIDATCVLSGNAGAVGGVNVSTGAVIRGETRPDSAPQTVPSIPVRQLVAEIEKYTNTRDRVGLVDYASGQPIKSYCFVNGGLNEPGDIHLDGGVLAVRGKLDVGGRVYGRGAVLVEGEIEVGRGSDVTTFEQFALVATENVTLEGGSSGGTHFLQGLVYSEKSIKAARLTVIGALISNSADPEQEVRLENVELVQAAVAVKAGYGLPLPLAMQGPGDKDSAAVTLRAEPNTAQPGKFRFWGESLYSSNPLEGTPPWPRKPSSEIFYLKMTLDPLQAELKKGEMLAGGPRWDSTQTLAFDGSQARTMELLELAFSQNASRRYFPQVRGQIESYMNALQGKATGPIINLHVNTLRSPVERTKVLLWREIESRTTRS